MASSSDKKNAGADEPIQNAEDIIERFGGIRPMASKMSIAVTTVQGWKKRNVIPANRREELLEAAAANDIDLDPFLTSSAPQKPQAAPQAPSKSSDESASEIAPRPAASSSSQANENDPARRVVSPQAPQKSAGAKPQAQAKASASHLGGTPSGHDKPSHNTAAELQAMTQEAMKRNLMLSGSLVVVALIAGFFFFGGDDVNRVKQDVSMLKTDVDNLEGRTSMLEGMVPEGLRSDLQQMKTNAQEMGQQVGQLAGEVGTITKTLSDESQGSIMNRIAVLEQRLMQGNTNEALQGLMTRIETMSSSMQGQQELSTAMQELSQVVQGMQGQIDNMDAALERAKQDNEALADTLEGVTGRDLGAAAMLLALGQVRSSLNRSAPFEEDLQVLQKIVGNDDPELTAAIDRLAPYAKQGVLSTDNLSAELKSISGDIIMAKMAGQDVSLQEKALQRFSEIVRLSKNGVPVTGAEEEAVIARAQKHLDEGNVEAAMRELSSLEGEAAQAAQPWMDKAQGTMAAKNLEEMLLQEVMTRMQGMGQGGMFNADSLKQLIPGQGQKIYTDPNTGMTIAQ